MDSEWLKTQFKLHPDKTKAGLAKALALEAPAVSKMLAGTRQIKAAEYVAMRRFFGLPVDGERAVAPKAGGKSVTLQPLAGLKEGDSAADDDSWRLPASLFAGRTKAPPEKIRIFTVQESAMVPDLAAGEPVVVDLADTSPSPPGAFVISDGLGHIVRQCEYIAHSSPPQVRISARSDRYEPYTLPLDKAGIIGRVIGKLQWL